MPIFRAQWKWEAGTGDPADDLVNTYHFDLDATTPAVRSNVRDLLVDFYDDQKSWLSEDALTGDYELKLYNLDDEKPRAPTDTFTGTITGLSSTGPAVAELAIVMSWQAAKVSGIPQARRRNRVYLGGFTSTSFSGTSAMVNPSTLTALQTAAQNFLDAAAASIDVQWVVYSPTNEQSYGINDGWIDNAPDIVRRRGHRPTTRVTFE